MWNLDSISRPFLTCLIVRAVVIDGLSSRGRHGLLIAISDRLAGRENREEVFRQRNTGLNPIGLRLLCGQFPAGATGKCTQDLLLEVFGRGVLNAISFGPSVVALHLCWVLIGCIGGHEHRAIFVGGFTSRSGVLTIGDEGVSGIDHQELRHGLVIVETADGHLPEHVSNMLF